VDPGNRSGAGEIDALVQYFIDKIDEIVIKQMMEGK
jgi:hypothetical protein